ncbi:hypothetical protein D3C76_1137770 [compost metagenome]
MAEAVPTAAAVVAPSPSATLLAVEAVAPLPMAMELVAELTACGPTAIESVPVAEESARADLAWKYLMPAPLSMSSIRVSSLFTSWLVAYSCEPLMASVLVPLMRPAATLVMVRSVPALPTLTVPVGVAPAKL